jgi:hypothetical protein
MSVYFHQRPLPGDPQKIEIQLQKFMCQMPGLFCHTDPDGSHKPEVATSRQCFDIFQQLHCREHGFLTCNSPQLENKQRLNVSYLEVWYCCF